MRKALAVIATLSSRRLMSSSAAAPDANALLQAALQLHQAGRLADAAALYGRVAVTLGARTPAAVHSNRGAALLALDQAAKPKI
jgi:hypothetical protein